MSVWPAREWACARGAVLAQAMATLRAERVYDPTELLHHECVPMSLLNVLSKAVMRMPSLAHPPTHSSVFLGSVSAGTVRGATPGSVGV